MFVATINVPGYLPDTDPVECDTAAEAWEHLASERTLDVQETGADPENDRALAVIRAFVEGTVPQSSEPTTVTWWRADNGTGVVIGMFDSAALCYCVSRSDHV